MTTAIEVSDLQRHFGSIRAVDAGLIWLGIRTFARASLLARL
jgi:hypothetical protein